MLMNTGQQQLRAYAEHAAQLKRSAPSEVQSTGVELFFGETLMAWMKKKSTPNIPL